METGWRIGNQVEIIRGLEAGEKIVTSGTFLIDSESKLELAAQGMYTTLSKGPGLRARSIPGESGKGRQEDHLSRQDLLFRLR